MTAPSARAQLFADKLYGKIQTRARSHEAGARDQAVGQALPVTAAAAAASSSSIDPGNLQALVHMQLQLMQEQLNVVRSRHFDVGYEEPEQILLRVEPDLRDIMKKWHKQLKADLGTWVTQEGLHAKYVQIDQRGEVHRTLRDQADRKWQWPKGYKAIAQPTSAEETDNDEVMPGDTAYDIDQAWKKLQEKHAKESWSFILTHQKACTEHMRSTTKSETCLKKLEDEVASWMAKHSDMHYPESAYHIKRTVKHFAEAVYRDELPKAKSRIEKDSENTQKREQELLDAEADYKSLDIKQLLALAVLETTRKSDNNSKLNLGKNGVMAHLMKEYPDLATKCNLNLNAEPKPKQKKQQRNRSQSRKSPGQRSSSRRSSAGFQEKRSSSRSKYVTSEGKSGGTGRSRSNSARSASRSSTKGKGRGKGRGKRKGRGSSKRSPTPFRKS